MEPKCLKVDINELMQTYEELLPQVDSLPLRVTGHSMSPFLVEDRDSVRLCKIEGKLQVGDIVLYKRDNGQYILHRICKIKNGAYSMIGDAHNYVEHGIKRNQIIAKVKSAERKGKILVPGNIIWEFFSKIWIRVIPLRRSIMKIISHIYRLFRRNKNESI